MLKTNARAENYYPPLALSEVSAYHVREGQRL